MKNILDKLFCKLGVHDYKAISKIIPVKRDFDHASLHKGAKCKQCGKIALVSFYGPYSWHGYDEMTKEEAMEYIKRINDE